MDRYSTIIRSPNKRPTSRAPPPRFASEIEASGAGAVGVVHSDLHREHLLVSNDASLTGVLDFGDAFIGATWWDFALLNWYYGKANAAAVARHHPAGSDVLDRGALLPTAVGLYEVAKKSGVRGPSGADHRDGTGSGRHSLSVLA